MPSGTAAQRSRERDAMARGSDFSPEQELFLLRAARLGELYRRHGHRAVAADGRGALVRWAVLSTLGDCARLCVEAEGRALLLTGLRPPADSRAPSHGDER
jgi:hypothetical protein